jgi:hypothetical protein
MSSRPSPEQNNPRHFPIRKYVGVIVGQRHGDRRCPVLTAGGFTPPKARRWEGDAPSTPCPTIVRNAYAQVMLAIPLLGCLGGHSTPETAVCLPSGSRHGPIKKCPTDIVDQTSGWPGLWGMRANRSRTFSPLSRRALGLRHNHLKKRATPNSAVLHGQLCLSMTAGSGRIRIMLIQLPHGLQEQCRPSACS